MNSKERVYAALRFQETDRVPRFVWLLFVLCPTYS